MRAAVVLAVLLLLIVACQPTPTPTPQPDNIGQTTLSFPILFSHPTRHPKAAIALAHAERGLPLGALGLPSGVNYHTWDVAGGATDVGTKISVVWCNANSGSGYDYPAAFNAYVRNKEIDEGPLTEFVLWANEPDRPDQCNIPAVEVAQLFLDLYAICPGCRFVGPMYSTADDGQKAAAVWDKVKELCGLPCPAMAGRYADSLHVYPRKLANLDPADRVTVLCNKLYSGPCQRPVWITEFGWTATAGNDRNGFANWLNSVDEDSRIERYFVYTTYQEPGSRFASLLDWDNSELTAMGRGFVFGAAAYP